MRLVGVIPGEDWDRLAACPCALAGCLADADVPGVDPMAVFAEWLGFVVQRGACDDRVGRLDPECPFESAKSIVVSDEEDDRAFGGHQ